MTNHTKKDILLKSMQITWLGQGCFKIEIKSGNDEVVIVTEPFDAEKTGLKLPRTLTSDLVVQSGEKLLHPVETKDGKRPFVISAPGEYEVKGVFVYAIPLVGADGAQEHLFWIEAENMILVHAGGLRHVPSEAELEKIEGLDILFASVGGGDGLDAKKAAELTRELEPRIVIPMMYNVSGLKLKADAVEPFLKAIGAKSETMPKLKIARKDLPVDDMKVVVLERA